MISGNYVLFGGKHAILNLELTHDVEFYDNTQLQPSAPGARGGFEFKIRFDTASVPAFTTGVAGLGGGPVTVRNNDFGGGGPLNNYNNQMKNTMGAAAGAFNVLGNIQVIGSMVGSRMEVVSSDNNPVPKPMTIFMSLQVSLFIPIVLT